MNKRLSTTICVGTVLLFILFGYIFICLLPTVEGTTSEIDHENGYKPVSAIFLTNGTNYVADSKTALFGRIEGEMLRVIIVKDTDTEEIKTVYAYVPLSEAEVEWE